MTHHDENRLTVRLLHPQAAEQALNGAPEGRYRIMEGKLLLGFGRGAEAAWSHAAGVVRSRLRQGCGFSPLMREEALLADLGAPVLPIGTVFGLPVYGDPAMAPGTLEVRPGKNGA